MWQNFYCKKTGGHFLGLQNSRRIIVGGLLIKQARTNILCPVCGTIRRDSWQAGNSKLLIFVTEEKVLQILGKDGYLRDAHHDELKLLEKKLNRV